MFFQSHETVERKASTDLESLMIVGKTEKNKSCQHDKAIQKYCCTSFGVCSTCLANSRDCGRLEKIQRKGLAHSMGCMSTASCEALEVQASVLHSVFGEKNLLYVNVQRSWLR